MRKYTFRAFLSDNSEVLDQHSPEGRKVIGESPIRFVVGDKVFEAEKHLGTMNGSITLSAREI